MNVVERLIKLVQKHGGDELSTSCEVCIEIRELKTKCDQSLKLQELLKEKMEFYQLQDDNDKLDADEEHSMIELQSLWKESKK